jgi:hypothetical protein
MHKTLIVVAVVALVATGAAQAGNDCPPPPCKYNCTPPPVTPPKVKTVIRYKTRVVVKHKTVTKTKCAEGSRMYKGNCHAIVKGSG